MLKLSILIFIEFLIEIFSYSTAIERLDPYLLLDFTNDTDINVKFSHVHSRNYENMIVVDEYLYLTGIDYVFKLNSIQIDDKSSSKYYERKFKVTSKKQSNNQNTSSNYIKYMGKSDSDLIICATNIEKPLILHLKPNDLSFDYEYDGMYLCPGFEMHKNLALISFNDELTMRKTDNLKRVMYSAIWLTHMTSEKDGIFSRYGIFRKDTKRNQSFLSSLFSPFWLWEPEFISIFEDSSHVYYFFNEYSIEDFIIYSNPEKINLIYNQTVHSSSNYKRIARIARVCKNDEGILNKLVWTTYRKIMIECKDRFKTFNNLSFINFIAIDNDTIVAIFDESSDFGATSVFCECKLSKIRDNFSFKEFLNLKQTNDDDFLYPNMDCDQQHTNLSNSDQDFKEDVFDFLTKNTILSLKLTFQYQYSLNCKISSMNIEQYSEKRRIFYVTTSDGFLLKIIRTLENTESMPNTILYRLITVFKIFQNSEIPIIQTLFHEKLRIIYVATNSEVLQINLNKTYCGKYKNCFHCQFDPYCEWKSSRCLSNEINDKNILSDNLNENYIKSHCKVENKLKNEIHFIKAYYNQTVFLNCYFELKDFALNSKFEFNLRFYLLKNLEWYKDSKPINYYKDLINYDISIDGSLILPIRSLNTFGSYNCFVASELINSTILELKQKINTDENYPISYHSKIKQVTSTTSTSIQNNLIHSNEIVVDKEINQISTWPKTVELNEQRKDVFTNTIITEIPITTNEIQDAKFLHSSSISIPKNSQAINYEATRLIEPVSSKKKHETEANDNHLFLGKETIQNLFTTTYTISRENSIYSKLKITEAINYEKNQLTTVVTESNSFKLNEKTVNNYFDSFLTTIQEFFFTSSTSTASITTTTTYVLDSSILTKFESKTSTDFSTKAKYTTTEIATSIDTQFK